MRRLNVLLVVLLVATACSGSGDRPTASAPETVTTEPTTTTAAATTTTGVATTTTATTAATGPWTTVPEVPGPPEVPLLLTASGEPEPIERMCIEVATEGLLNPTSRVRGFTRALQILGIEVVETDCEAAVRVTGEASRYSAEYTGVGTCWAGERATTEVSLVIGGSVVKSWTAEKDSEPPSTITAAQCDDPDDPVSAAGGDATLTIPMQEMWGNLGRFAVEASNAYDDFPFDVEIDDDAIQLMEWLLSTEPITGEFDYPPFYDVLNAWTSFARRHEIPEVLEPLLPLVPIVISLLSQPDGGGSTPGSRWTSAHRTVHGILENFSDLEFETPSEWWSWWESQD